MVALKFNTKCCALVVLILCLIPILLAAPHKKNKSVVKIRDEASGLRYNVYYYDDLTGYAIRLLIPKLKNIKNHIKNKGAGREIETGHPVNSIEKPSSSDVISTTTSIPISMKNCTQPETGTQTSSTVKGPCLDADYYDEDEDDLGDRLGQNAVLSLIG